MDADRCDVLALDMTLGNTNPSPINPLSKDLDHAIVQKQNKSAEGEEEEKLFSTVSSPAKKDSLEAEAKMKVRLS